MKPDKFAALPTTEDGRPVIKLMTDPEMTDGFLSLVNKGANGRRVSVVKADVPTSSPDQDIVSDNGQTAAGIAWWRRLFGGLFTSKTSATKSDGPTTFDAAYAVDRMRTELWRATDQLVSVIWNIMGDEETSDKPGAVRVACQQFSDHVVGLASVVQVSKVEDRAGVAKAVRELVTKEGRVLSAASSGKIKAAAAALQAAIEALAALQESAGTASKAEAQPTTTVAPPEDSAMKLDPAALALVAKAAAETAITVAKGAGITDAAQLAQIGVTAQTEVFKAAVQGPPQPGLPTTVLADQRSQAGGEGGSPSAPESAVMAKLNQLGGMVAKLDEELLGKADAAGKRTGGLVAVVEKQADVLDAVTERVSKFATTPRPSNAGGDAPERQVVHKDARAPETAFKGTALSFTEQAPANR